MKSQVGQPVEDQANISALQWFNVALRGVMELGIVAAMGYWGYQAGSSLVPKVLLAILAPLIVFGFWGLVDFHQAGHMAEFLRLAQELVISGLAAFALYTSGQQALAWALGLIAIIQHSLVYMLGETLLKRS
jgi:Protein of unknown function (DUF2568)